MNRRHLLCAVTLSAAIVFNSGCSRSGQPDPVEPSTTSSSPDATGSPVESEEWKTGFSANEIQAYDEALATLEEYRRSSEPVYAAGKATPAAKKLLQRYLIPWQGFWSQLQRFDEAGIRIARNPVVIRSKATRIELGSDGASVTIRQCLDSSDIGATQAGDPLQNAFKTPQVQVAVMAEVDDRWYVSDLPSTPEDRPCSA